MPVLSSSLSFSTAPASTTAPVTDLKALSQPHHQGKNMRISCIKLLARHSLVAANWIVTIDRHTYLAASAMKTLQDRLVSPRWMDVLWWPSLAMRT